MNAYQKPTETFAHYSAKLLSSVRSVQQLDNRGHKPSGLWFSVDDSDLNEPVGWTEWCRAERYNLGKLKHRTEVVLAPDARVLRLSDALDIDAFHEQYAIEAWCVDWPRVATEYQAIVIAPYMWSRRLSAVRWYYSWDCASGCVWDAEAILKLRQIREAIEAVGGE